MAHDHTLVVHYNGNGVFHSEQNAGVHIISARGESLHCLGLEASVRATSGPLIQAQAALPSSRH